MSCFLLPSGLCQDIEQQMCRFWWGDGTDKRKVHWMSWKRMCLPKDKGGMGFRDMEAFNLALLAKQGWRLLNDHSSLLARILKARYYPRSSFMDAKEGFQPSYAWRSILKGREVLSKGLRWQVGNGANIRVFEDQWLPRAHSFKPITHQYEFGKDLYVADLINWEEGGWITPIVEEIFHPLGAEIITGMRLIDQSVEDEQIWHFTKDGIFSVRTAYHMWIELSISASSASSSDSNKMQKLWRKLWKCPVQPRIRDFLWRSCRSLLPCRENLHRRKIIEHNYCDLCGAAEDETHVIVHCRAAKSVWKLQPQFSFLRSYKGNFLNLFDYIQAKAPSDDLQLWAYMPEAIWGARNRHLFEETQVNPRELVDHIMELVAEYRAAVLTVNPTTTPPAVGECSWSIPPPGFYKVNCDAAVDDEAGCGTGFLVRNSQGNVALFAARRVKNHKEVEVVEAEAIIWALEVCLERGFGHVWVECNCLALIYKLQRRCVIKGELGNLTNRIVYLSSLFHECRWSHVRRNANRAADFLAKIKPSISFIHNSSLLIPFELKLIVSDDLK